MTRDKLIEILKATGAPTAKVLVENPSLPGNFTPYVEVREMTIASERYVVIKAQEQ